MCWTKLPEFITESLNAHRFSTTEVWTMGGMVTHYELFFIHLGSRQVHIACVTTHPNASWMKQIARNMTMEEREFLEPGQYLIHV